MQRKVIAQGNDTLTITLPREWTRKYSIAPGDLLDCELGTHSLTLSSRKVIHDRTFKISVDSKNKKVIRWTIGSLFRIGADKIILNFKSEEMMTTIQEVVNKNLQGYIITEQRKNVCVIRSITTDDESTLKGLRNRSYMIVMSLADNLGNILKEGNYKKIADIIYLHDNSDQTIALCQRIIGKNVYSDVVKSSYLISLLENLELIGDAYRDIGKMCYKQKGQFNNSKMLIELFNEVSDVFHKVRPAFFELSNPPEEIYALIDKINKKIGAKVGKMKGDETFFLFTLSQILHLIRNFFPTLIVLFLNKQNNAEL